MKLCVKVDDQFFEVELGDLHARPVLATVDGDTFEIWPEEQGGGTPGSEALGSEALGSGTPVSATKEPAVAAPQSPLAATPAGAAPTTSEVLAPIPGVILSITVKPGDSVVFGQELCVLEAMKMKNHIRANRAGTIASVCIESGDQVKHGQVLMAYTN